MKTPLSAIALCLCAFAGGAFAQTIGGGMGAAFAATNWLSLIGSLSGSPTSYSCAAGGTCFDINRIGINGDTQSAGTNTLLSGLGVTHSFGGAGINSYVNGIASYFSMTATTGNMAGGQYVGNLSMAFATANDNGTVGTPAGGLWASNPNAFLASGATNWAWLAGEEIDVTVGAGASVADKQGLVIVQGSMDAVKGSRSNIGLAISNQSGAQGWDCGLCFGSYSGNNPITAGGTLIGTWQHAGTLGGGSMGTVANGIDFRRYSFTGTPFGAPLATPASSSAACVTGGMEYDASFIYICTATNTWKRATLASF